MYFIFMAEAHPRATATPTDGPRAARGAPGGAGGGGAAAGPSTQQARASSGLPRRTARARDPSVERARARRVCHVWRERWSRGVSALAPQSAHSQTQAPHTTGHRAHIGESESSLHGPRARSPESRVRARPAARGLAPEHYTNLYSERGAPLRASTSTQHGSSQLNAHLHGHFFLLSFCLGLGRVYFLVGTNSPNL